MDTEGIGCFGEASVASPEHPRDEPLFEFADGVVEQDAPVHHFLDEFLESVADHARLRPVRRRNASMYLSRVLATTSSGREGTGGCLFHLMRSR